MVKITKVTKSEYDPFIQNRAVQYLQKSYWGDLKAYFQEYTPEYFIIYEGEKVIGGFLSLKRTIKKSLLRLKVTYIPRTTIFFYPREITNEDTFHQTLERIRSLNSITLLDLEYPYWEKEFLSNEEWINYVLAQAKKSSIQTINYHIQAGATIIKNTFEEDLLASIPSSNAKRNCKRGAKKLKELGINFEVKNKLESEELKEAYELITEVSSTKEFNKRSFEYFQKLQEIPESIWFIFRDKESKIVLANYGIVNPHTSSYTDLYVGRKLDYDKYYISYVLKLSSFEYLRAREIKYYDHWGVDLSPESEMYRFSQFKLHFGGEIIHYLPILVLTKGFVGNIAKMGIFLIKSLRKQSF